MNSWVKVVLVNIFFIEKHQARATDIPLSFFSLISQHRRCTNRGKGLRMSAQPKQKGATAAGASLLPENRQKRMGNNENSYTRIPGLLAYLREKGKTS